VAPTPAPSATPTVAASATPAPTATPTATTAPRQDATPTPEPSPTATATPGFTGATLTICHYADGVYETVQIDAGGFDEHYDHEDDVIPAPSGGCDEAGAGGDDFVLVCHATGDEERPFTIVQVPSDEGLGGHERHPGDLIPAPDRTCPGLDFYFVPTPVPTPTATAEPSASPEPTATAEPTPDDRGGDGDDRDGRGGTLPTFRGSMLTALEQGAAPAQQLPFTGLELWLIAAAGAAMTLMGLGLRLLAAQPPVGVTR
jgi:hypothetical protein